nr:hypothetical protein [Tanacetum cinerariifolium]
LKFDYLLEEFFSELAHIDPIPPGIEEADFDLEEEIRLVEHLLYDNSSPRPPEELNAEIANRIVEYLSQSPIYVEDSDSLMENIHLFLYTDDLMPSGIEYDNYDSKGDIHFLEELLSGDPLSLPENESFNFDHHDDPSFSLVEDISEHYVLMPKVLPSQSTLCPNIDTLLSFSSKNKDKVFKPGILSYLLESHWDKIIFDFSKNPMMISGEDIPLLDFCISISILLDQAQVWRIESGSRLGNGYVKVEKNKAKRTKPGTRMERNYGFLAEKRTNSTIPADDVVPTDVVPASAFIFTEPTILADRVIVAEASVLVVDVQEKNTRIRQEMKCYKLVISPLFF